MSSMQIRFLPVVALVALLFCAGVSCAVEIPSNSGFLKTEMAVTGVSPSVLWHGAGAAAGLALDQIGGDGVSQPDEFGGGTAKSDHENEMEDDGDEGPSNLGRKVKAGLFSAILPGAGQFYNDQRKKAYIMVGAEAAIWTAYFVFDTQGDNRMESAAEYAGIYAGTSGDHENSYWQNVGKYLDSDEYDDARRREARALQEEFGGPTSAADSWLWVNDDRQYEYRKLRSSGNSAYDRRDFMILFAVINRAISVVDAVIGAGSTPGALETEVLGMKLEMEMLPSWRDPGAQCVISRRF
jgi:Family of unknown function (DUF5683)